MESNDAVIALAALAQGSRLSIFLLLVQQGVEGRVVGKITEATELAPATLSFHLNWQYHASTCDPLRFGSGNKVLHNVVGGNLGIFEGNGGDLRIGLSRQSLHDGKRWMHEPLRLTVIIDAPQQAIESVIDKHEVIQQLLDHNWLFLWRFDQSQLLGYQQGQWHPVLGTDA